ncbi:MAG: hypothetical protein SFW07_03950 [Gammaproteobacteria bacterium]|nr:hypothetical protein [Gammaproteobacteria bacterium]
MPKSTEAVWNEIHDVTGPLEKTLKALAENPNAKNPGKEQAEGNGRIIKGLNDFGNSKVNQLTQTKSVGIGMRKGSNSSSNPEDERKK